MSEQTTTEPQATIEQAEAPKAKRARRRKKGRGSIYRRRDGRWCAEMTKPDGGRKYIYGGTAAEVETRLTAAKATVDAGGSLGDERTTVSAVLDRFLEERAGRVRSSTIAAYKGIADRNLKPGLGRVPVRQLTPAHVQAFTAKLSRDGMTPSMVQHVLVVLRMALALAEDWGFVMRNVARKVKGPKVERPELVPLTAEETKKLLAVARTHRLGGIWWLAARLGLRRGEVLGLRWADVDLDVGAVTIRHQLQHVAEGEGVTRSVLVPPKTKRSVRTLPILPDVVVVLRERKAAQAREHLKVGEKWENPLGLIFTSLRGHAIDGCRHHRLHKTLCKAAGVRDVRFHDLRHGAATLMLGAGADVVNLSASLGHADVGFSLSRYTHATQPRMDDAVGRLGVVLGLGE